MRIFALLFSPFLLGLLPCIAEEGAPAVPESSAAPATPAAPAAPADPATAPAPPEKPALKVEKFTLKDGRTLEGIFDAEQGKMKLFSQSGRPMGSMELKEAEIEKREPSSIVVKETSAEPKKREPPPKLTEVDRLEREVLEQIEIVKKDLAGLKAMDRSKTKYREQHSSKATTPDELKQFYKQMTSYDEMMQRQQKALEAAQKKLDESKAAYTKAGGKKTFEQ